MKVTCITLLLFVFLLSWLLAPASLAQSFDHADRHAGEINTEAQRSAEELATRLTEPFSREDEKARALFSWITHNISYDTDAFFQEKQSNESPGDVLRNRVALCGGFATLFTTLAKHAGLESVVVYGHSQGYGVQPGGSADVNHAWNAVKIDGQWKLLDTTWGAGYIDKDSKRFVRHFNEHYFLTDPTQLIYGHFPRDPDWQLLEQPVTESEFMDMVRLQPPFFSHELQLVSHKTAEVETSGSGMIELKVPHDRVIIARLMQNDVQLDNNSVLVHHNGTRGLVEFYPPQRGKYQLEVFVKPTGSDNSEFKRAASYTIRNNREMADSGFPETFGRFLEHRSMLAQPRAYLLEAKTEISFSLNVPGAEAVTVVNNDNWTDLSKNDEQFSGNVPLQPGTVQVAARFPDSDRYHVLLQYMAR